MGCRQPYRLTREVRFELVVDLIGDAVPRLGADYRLITEFLHQFFERHPGNVRGVLAERVHDERLRERAVPRERHDVREAFEVGHGHRVRWKRGNVASRAWRWRIASRMLGDRLTAVPDRRWMNPYSA